MIDEEQLKNVRLFQMNSGQEVIGYLRGKSLRGAYVEVPAKIITEYFFPDGQIRKSPLQGFFPYGCGEPLETVFIKNHSFASETTPRPEIVEMWLNYAYPSMEDIDDPAVESTPTASGLELC